MIYPEKMVIFPQFSQRVGVPSGSSQRGAVGRHQRGAGAEGLHPAPGSHQAGLAHSAADLGAVQVSEEWPGRRKSNESSEEG